MPTMFSITLFSYVSMHKSSASENSDDKNAFYSEFIL